GRFGAVRHELEDWAINRKCKDGDQWQIPTDCKTWHQRMKKLAVWVLVLGCAFGMRLAAQISTAPAESPAKASKAEKPKDKAKNKDKKKQDKSSGTNLFGSSAGGPQSDQPTTTEIYADEAFFDSTKNMGIFSGRVKVVDPRFNL